MSSAVFGPGPLVSEGELHENLLGVGSGVRVFQGARIIKPEVVKLGKRCQIDEGVFIFGGLETSIGDYAHFAWGSCVIGGGVTRVGQHVGVSSGVRLVSGSEDYDMGLVTPAVEAPYRLPNRGRCIIEDHALIFANAVVLPDVTIGSGAVVGAGSVVHRSLKPWGIYAGAPLVQIGWRDREQVLNAANGFHNVEQE